MHARLLALSIAPLFAATVAHAQAPGEIVPQQPPAAVPQPPGCVAPCAGCGHAPVMANRWAIGVSLGAISLAPDSDPDNRTRFAGGELALRFRATPHLELEVSAGGGRERTANDQDGDLEIATVAVAARYRLWPEDDWNAFVMGGLGGAAVVRHDATDQERNDALQPLAMLGVGIERRFEHLALQAEARAVGLGDRRDTSATADTAAMSTTTTPPVIRRSGGQFTIGLSYYF